MPRTLENTREWDETLLIQPSVSDATLPASSPEDQDEVLHAEKYDAFAQYFDGRVPKIIITTSKRPSTTTYRFTEELLSVFPNSEFVKRGVRYDIADIVTFCAKREYTDLIIVNEDRKTPSIPLPFSRFFYIISLLF